MRIKLNKQLILESLDDIQDAMDNGDQYKLDALDGKTEVMPQDKDLNDTMKKFNNIDSKKLTETPTNDNSGETKVTKAAAPKTTSTEVLKKESTPAPKATSTEAPKPATTTPAPKQEGMSNVAKGALGGALGGAAAGGAYLYSNRNKR